MFAIRPLCCCFIILKGVTGSVSTFSCGYLTLGGFPVGSRVFTTILSEAYPTLLSATDRQTASQIVGRRVFVVLYSVWWLSITVRTCLAYVGDICYNVGEWYPSTLCTAVVRSFAWRNTCAPLLSTSDSHECWVGMDANLCTTQRTKHLHWSTVGGGKAQLSPSACSLWLIERCSSSICWSSVCVAAWPWQQQQQQQL